MPQKSDLTFDFLRTYLAGQIARAVSVFQVDEVIVFDESGDAAKGTDGEFTGVKKKGNPNQTLARILREYGCIKAKYSFRIFGMSSIPTKRHVSAAQRFEVCRTFEPFGYSTSFEVEFLCGIFC